MSSLFRHRHYWRRICNHPIADGPRTAGSLIVEECRCGAVRTIEIQPGHAPVVRHEERA